MTRERAKELLPIIQAYAEGKDVEFDDGNGKWRTTQDPSWVNYKRYRIKPEKKYQPFTADNWRLFKGKSVYNNTNEHLGKFNKCLGEIYEWDETGVRVIGSRSDQNIYIYYSALLDYTFADGSPCGKEVIVSGERFKAINNTCEKK